MSELLLVDSSVWIEFLRRTGSRSHLQLRQLVTDEPDRVVTTEPVIMELLAGATDDRSLVQLENLTNGLPLLRVESRIDYREAASIHRAARRTGKTVRSMVDCLIAAVALRNDATLVHKDIDYEVLCSAIGAQAISWR